MYLRKRKTVKVSYKSCAGVLWRGVESLKRSKKSRSSPKSDQKNHYFKAHNI
jgi:hypothetical protein